MKRVALITTLNGLNAFYDKHQSDSVFAGFGLAPCYTNIPLEFWFYMFGNPSLRKIASVLPCDEDKMIKVEGIFEAVRFLQDKGYGRIVVQ